MAPQRIDPIDQADAICRDRALKREDLFVLLAPDLIRLAGKIALSKVKPIAILSCTPGALTPVPIERMLWTPTAGRHNYADEQQRTLWNMHAMLTGTFQPTFTSGPSKQSSLLSTLPIKAPKIDLFEISAIAYDLLSKKTSHDAFVTTLDELDALISDHQDMDYTA